MAGERKAIAAPAGDPLAHAWSETLEQGVLGVILDGRKPDAWAVFSEHCPSAAVFHKREHRLIGVVMHRLGLEGRPVDLLSVQEALLQVRYADAVNALRELDGERPGRVEPDGSLDPADSVFAAVGGTILSDLVAAGFAGDFTRRVRDLADLWRLRRMIRGLAEIQGQMTAVGAVTRMRELSDAVINLGARATIGGATAHTTLAQAGRDVLEHHDELRKAGRTDPAAAWGIPHLDRTVPLKAGQLIVLAAAPGCGKTSAMLQVVVESTAILGPSSMAVVSLEMSRQELATINLSRELRVARRSIECGWLDHEMRAKADQVTTRWMADDIAILDNSERCTLDDLIAWARRMHLRSGGRLRLLCIDYLQIIDASSDRQNDYEKLAKATRGLKRLAGQLDVCVLLLSQLSREGTKVQRGKGKPDESPEPTLDHLRGSGTIGQDANAVVFLWPASPGDESPTVAVRCRVAKNRSGPLATCDLEFRKADGQRLVQSWPAVEADAGETASRFARIAAEPSPAEDAYAPPM